MPALAPNQVTLSDILEVRGGPLNEDELWAVLYQCCDKVKDIFLTGKIQQLNDVVKVLCPDNLILCGSGKIKFGCENATISADRRFLPPEIFLIGEEEINPAMLEKMIIYTLGMNIYASAEYGAKSVVDLCLNPEIEELLMYMCEDDPNIRCNLSQVLQACNSKKGIFLSVERIRSLVKSILGSDLHLESSPSSSPVGFSSSSALLRISNHPSDISNSFSLTKLQSLPSLSSTYVDVTTKGLTSSDLKYGDVSDGKPVKSVTDGKVRNGIHATKINPDDLEESYEPLTKTHQRDFEAEISQSSLQKSGQSIEDHSSHEKSQGESLETLPPLNRVKPISREKNKSAYSTPNFKRLMTIEKKKLTNDGYLDEEKSKIKIIDHRYKSMPSLEMTEEKCSPQRSEKGSTKSAEYPYNQTGNYRKLTRLASRGSVESESVATSMFSSTLSLNHGSYTLDVNNDRFLRRPLSLYSVSSNDVNGENYTPRFQQRFEHLAKGGPEFILVPNDDELAIVDITPARLGPVPRGRKKLSVLLPNAQKLTLVVEVSSLAKDVFDQVADYLGIKETVYFGLTQIKDGEHLFLDLDSKISKVAPSGWKDDKKNKIEFILHFKVKFFIGEVSLLKHQITRHMFYLQLRREILCSYIFCQDEAAIYLASLALQAEFGDYVSHHHGKCYFTAEHYLPGRILSRLSRSDIFHQLPLMHHSHRGLPEGDAELRFIQEAQHLREYGLLLYQVSRSKKDKADSILFGISVRGILLFELRGQLKNEIHRQQWHFIEKFIFRRKKFIVQPRKASGLPPLTLYTNSYKKSKYLLRMCQSFHRFSLLYKPKALLNENARKTMPDSEKKQDKYKENIKLNGMEMRRDNSSIDEERFDDIEINRKSPNQQFINQQSLNQSIKANASNVDRVEGRHANIARFRREKSRDSNGFSPDARRRLSTLPGAQDRKVKVVHLSRRPGQGLGVTIVGGEDSKRLGNGIFIKSIHPGGLAAMEGSLQKGDRLLSVNGQSLEEVTHERAAHLLTCASEEVDLIVSQMSPGSSFLDKSGLSHFEESKIIGTLDDPDMIEVKEYEQLRLAGPLKQKASFPLSPILTQSPQNSRVKQKEDDRNVGHKTKHEVSENEVIVSTQNEIEEIPSFDEDEIHADFYSENHQMSQVNETEGQLSMEREENEIEEPIDECMLIDLQKKNNSWGLVFMGGIGSGLPHNGIYVKTIEQDGAAYEDGRIKIGDRVIEANGISLEYVTYKQAMEILKRIPSKTTLLVARSLDIHSDILQETQPRSPTKKSLDTTSKRSQVMQETFSVVLEKGAGGLGLSLTGGNGSDPAFKDNIVIRRLFPGQPAALCGKLRIGDVILSVNDQPLDEFSQQEAINLLRCQQSKVRLIVKRPSPSEIPEELLIESPRGNLDPQLVLHNIQKKLTEQAHREMPQTPDDKNQSFEYDEKEANERGIHDTEDEIIPYMAVKNFVPVASHSGEENTSSGPTSGNRNMKKLSSNEIIVHAQIEMTNHKPDEASHADEKRKDNRQFSLPDLPNEQPLSLQNKREVMTPNEHTNSKSSNTNNKNYIDDMSSKIQSSEKSDYDDEFYSRFDSIGMSALRTNSSGTSNQIIKPNVTEKSENSNAEQKLNQILNERNYEEIKENEPTSMTSQIVAPHSDRESDTESHSSRGPKYEYIETVLSKGSTGLGLTLAGGKSTTGGCYIRDIVSDPAKSNGKLKSGDQIIKVDSINISNFEHMEAVDTLRNTSKSVHLTVKRKLSSKRKSKLDHDCEIIKMFRNENGKYGVVLKEDNGEIMVENALDAEKTFLNGSLHHGDIIKSINDKSVKGLNAIAAQQLLDSAHSPVQLTIQRRRQAAKESKYAVDAKEESSAFKIGHISSGYGTDRSEKSLKNGGQEDPTVSTIKKSLPPFTRSDSLRSDSSTTSSPKKSSIKNSPLLKRLDVLQDSQQNPMMRKTSSQEDKGEIILVQLTKGSSGLGMSLTGNNDFGDEAGAFVANINTGSVAEKSGKLKKGDKLMSINGENVENKSQKEVVSILRNISGRIDLEVFRFPHQYPFENVNTTRPSSNNSNHSNIDLSDVISHISFEENKTQNSIPSSKKSSTSEIVNNEVVFPEETDNRQTTTDVREDYLMTQPNEHENDLSWEDSEISEDENLEHHLTQLSNKEVKTRNFNLSLQENSNVDEQGNQDPSASFSSTFENVTPSSSILTSTLEDITSDNSSNDSDFQDISPSLIPDLSSVQRRTEIEGIHDGNLNGSFVNRKLYENDEDEANAVNEGSDIENHQFKEIQEEKYVENNDEIDELHGYDDDGDHDDDGNISHDIIIDEKPDFSSEIESIQKHNDKQLNYSHEERKDELTHSASVLQIENNKNEINKSDGTMISSSHKNSRLNESKIPILNQTALMKHDQELSQKLKVKSRSGIPIRSPPRSPSKKNSIEMKAQEPNSITQKTFQMETSFISGDYEFDDDDDDEKEDDNDDGDDYDDDFTLDLTADTLTNSYEIDSRMLHYQSILESDKIDKEFQIIKDMRPVDGCDVARRSVNRDKNRFRSILPYDKTRICLAGGEESDYINANRVKLHLDDIHGDYIAAQGPLPNTVADFWRMIWEYKVDTIVMVTKDVEGGKVKCHRYWPDMPGLPMKASDRFKIDLVHRKDHGHFIERQFSLINLKLNKSVPINHFLFTAWPDAGLPKEPSPFLLFVKQTLEVSSSAPLLVHCSAGTGRTGLFIITHWMKKLITKSQNFEIVEIVKSLKRQRQSLIQTMDQYSFSYKMAFEIIKDEKH